MIDVANENDHYCFICSTFHLNVASHITKLVTMMELHSLTARCHSFVFFIGYLRFYCWERPASSLFMDDGTRCKQKKYVLRTSASHFSAIVSPMGSARPLIGRAAANQRPCRGNRSPGRRVSKSNRRFFVFLGKLLDLFQYLVSDRFSLEIRIFWKKKFGNFWRKTFGSDEQPPLGFLCQFLRFMADSLNHWSHGNPKGKKYVHSNSFEN